MAFSPPSLDIGLLNNVEELANGDIINGARKFQNQNESQEPPKKRKYKFGDRIILSKAMDLDDRIFKRAFGLSKETFLKFFDLIFDKLPHGKSVNGKNILEIEMLLVFFWWARTASDNLHDSISHQMSEASIWKCIDSVIKAVYEIVPDLITLPTPQEAAAEARLFQSKSGFPPIAYGAIDGTHIPVSISRKTLDFGSFSLL